MRSRAWWATEDIPRRLKSWELGDKRRLKTGWDGQANIRVEGSGERCLELMLREAAEY